MNSTITQFLETLGTTQVYMPLPGLELGAITEVNKQTSDIELVASEKKLMTSQSW